MLKKRLFKSQPTSAKIAKNRLQLVISRERVGVPERKVAELKEELCEVISKYFEIDADSLEVEVFDKKGYSSLSVSTPVIPSKRPIP